MSQHSSSAKIMFYYLLVLVALCFTSIGLGQILFQVINAVFPDAIYYYEGTFSQYTLRFGISSVIVAAPIYWLISHIIHKELQKKEIDAHSAIRKWLTYLILFVSSITVLGLLIGILNSFLNGEITVKFILKWLTVLVLSGSIFLYYLYDIRRTDFKTNSIIWGSRVFFSVLVLGTLIAGFCYLDLPSEVRAQRQDEERVNRLRNITYQVNEFYGQKKKLPQTLEELGDKILPVQLKDPVTNKPFEYSAKGVSAYELCAEFETSNKEAAERGRTDYYWADPEFIHDKGRQCFEKEVPEGFLMAMPPPSLK